MTTLTIRQKLISYLADADDKELEAVYNFLKEDMQDSQTFTLTDEQLQMLEKDREAHVNGQSKSYSRQEATEIIKGKRSF
jgi:hypothetical protein